MSPEHQKQGNSPMDRTIIAAVVLTAGAFVAGADAQTTEKSTDTLMKELSSSHHPSREKAFKLLQGKYDDALEQELLSAKPNDLEGRRRIDALLSPYHEKQVRVRVENMIKACKGKLPWIDMQDNSCAKNHYYSITPDKDSSPPEYRNYRKATELMLMDRSMERFDFTPLVQHMKQRQNAWLKEHHFPPEYVD